LYRAIDLAENSVGEYPDWSTAGEMRFWSEENCGRGKVRRRRGRRLLKYDDYFFFAAFFAGFFAAAFFAAM
jgi:hypothetical protein